MGSRERRTGEEYEAAPVCVLDLISFSGGELTLASHPSANRSTVEPNGPFRRAEMLSAVRPGQARTRAATGSKWGKKKISVRLIRVELECSSSQ